MNRRPFAATRHALVAIPLALSIAVSSSPARSGEQSAEPVVLAPAVPGAEADAGGTRPALLPNPVIAPAQAPPPGSTPPPPPPPQPSPVASVAAVAAVASEPPSRQAHPRCPGALGLRLAPVETLQRLFNLSFLGGGGMASLDLGGCHLEGSSVAVTFVRGESLGGLRFDRFLAAVANEWALGDSGLRLGFGAGISYFDIQRATDGGMLRSVGLDGFGRFGYDTGARYRPFALLDFDVQLQAAQSFVWGPTLAVGIRL